MFFSFGCFVSQIIYRVHCSLKWHLNTGSFLSQLCVYGVLALFRSLFVNVCLFGLQLRHQKKQLQSSSLQTLKHNNTVFVWCWTISVSLWLPFILPCSRWNVIWIQSLNNKILDALSLCPDFVVLLFLTFSKRLLHKAGKNVIFLEKCFYQNNISISQASVDSCEVF